MINVYDSSYFVLTLVTMIEAVEYPCIRVLDDVMCCVNNLTFGVYIVIIEVEVVKYAHVTTYENICYENIDRYLSLKEA